MFRLLSMYMGRRVLIEAYLYARTEAFFLGASFMSFLVDNSPIKEYNGISRGISWIRRC